MGNVEYREQDHVDVEEGHLCEWPIYVYVI